MVPPGPDRFAVRAEAASRCSAQAASRCWAQAALPRRARAGSRRRARAVSWCWGRRRLKSCWAWVVSWCRFQTASSCERRRLCRAGRGQLHAAGRGGLRGARPSGFAMLGAGRLVVLGPGGFVVRVQVASSCGGRGSAVPGAGGFAVLVQAARGARSRRLGYAGRRWLRLRPCSRRCGRARVRGWCRCQGLLCAVRLRCCVDGGGIRPLATRAFRCWSPYL
jgi:hypothetical protein